VVLICAALAGAYWLHARGALEWEQETLQSWLSSVGPLAPLLFVGLVMFRPFLLIPSGLLLFAAGLLFGTLVGTLWATLGGTLGALLAFTLARLLGRPAVERRLSGAAAQVDSYLGSRGSLWVAVLTALPGTPLTAVHSAAGLSSLRLAPFVLGVVAGLVPRCAVYAYFGDALAERDLRQFWVASALLAGALALSFLVRRRLFPGRRSASEGADPPTGPSSEG
jgi:uncharacterized membrane protein YdjX (TVP38/TMEM64 family)